ncbi:unnamed protein product [Soboliphyme baturini]|uniref:Sugar transporter SWEET1 n=1 Tax=Soboliphyme baturini TaxID=241478 RepID=A0A183JA83_9BILA|nr:unnamed protein product [Soboliphyme baturini]
MDFVDIVALVATVSTIGMFLVGICYFWLQYGFLKQDRTIILVNTIGLVLQLLYTLIFYLYANSKRQITTLIFISAVACSCLSVYLRYMSRDLETVTSQLGMMCLLLNILNFAAPFAVLVRIHIDCPFNFPTALCHCINSVLFTDKSACWSVSFYEFQCEYKLCLHFITVPVKALLSL